DLELQDRIVGLATSVALALLGLRLGHALDVSTEVLPPHDLLDRFQRIAFGADRLKPALNIEKARLPHDSLAPSAHGPLRSASPLCSDLARRIFRGSYIINSFLFESKLIGRSKPAGRAFFVPPFAQIKIFKSKFALASFGGTKHLIVH